MFCLLAGCARQDAWIPPADDLFVEESAEQARELVRAFSPKKQGLTSWRELEPGIQAGLAYVSGKNPDEVAMADGMVAVTWAESRESLRLLLELLPRLDAEPELLASRFRWMRLTGNAHFSGYYEAEVPASRTRKPGFEHPLYAVPKDLRSARLNDFHKELVGMRLVYRIDSGGDMVPYYTREDIDVDGALKGRGLEIAWVADPVDAFFLQVQGSGRLRMDDGSSVHVLYAGDNGRPYTALGQVLAGMGQIDPQKVSMQYIRQWLAANPHKRTAMLNRNQRYVFFRLADTGPVGSMGAQLTPNVSLAVDRTTFPLGSALLFSTPLPQEGRLSGIGLAQDTGGAIKLRRIDIFCGHGASAALRAGHLNERGDAWLLLAR